MKSTATSKHGQNKAEPARSHAGNSLRSNSSTGYLGQLAATINGSPRVLAQRKLAQEIQSSPKMQAQQQLASEINEDRTVPARPSVIQTQRMQLEQDRKTFSTEASSPIQPRFNIELLLQDPEKRDRLFSEGIDVDLLEEIQELMENKEQVNEYLKELEASMQEWFSRQELSHYKYTTALDLALFEQEKKWMVPGAKPVNSKKDRETIAAENQVESSEKFLKRIQGGKPLKDVGAAVSHGEYAHRIQWYVISRHFNAIPAALVKRIYEILGDSGFEQEVRGYGASMLNDMWSLWNALVDVPASIQKGPIGDVGFSAPVTLTGAISRGEGEMQYSQLRLAILNRRIKRYFQEDPDPKRAGLGRSDQAMAAMLGNLGSTMEAAKCPQQQIKTVLKILGNAGEFANNAKHKPCPFDYDQRNLIAFGLAGIPLSS